MKIDRSNHHAKYRLIVALGVIILVAALVVGYMYTMGYGPFAKTTTNSSDTAAPSTNKTDYNPPSAAQVTVGAKTKEAVAESTPTSPTVPSSTIGIVITSDGVNGDTYSIRTLIDTVTSNGTCSLSMKSASGKTYSESVGVQPLSSNSTCRGFNIPLTSLSRGETWHINLTLTSGDLQGSVEKDVSL